MFEFLSGSIFGKTPTEVIMDVNGVGYIAQVSLRTSERLPSIGTQFKLLLHYKVSEDQARFFGFVDDEERSLFRELIAVAGIGPAHALALLSGNDPNDIWHLILEQDAKGLAKTKGIGPKIAQRVCTELKDKAARQGVVRSPESPVTPGSSPAPQMEDDAVSALLVLGYSDTQARKAVAKALAQDPNQELEELVRHALKMA